MALFDNDGFTDGRWAGNLCKELLPLSLIPGLEPRVRLWRGTWQQWIQLEREDLPVGPLFWSGKPAVVSSPAALYVGYYVERGLPPGQTDPKLVMTPEWHWHGFYRALSEESVLSSLSAIAASLPQMRRCIWVSHSSNRTGHPYPFDGPSTLATVKAYVDSIPPNEWVDVVVGVRYSKDECLGLQNRIVEEIIEPLKWGHELHNLVCSAQQLSAG